MKNLKTFQDTNEKAICKHISRVMGSNKRTPFIIREIQNWYSKTKGKSMKMDWTLERLKLYKRAVIRYQADESFKNNKEFPLKRNSQWIKTDGEGWPKGPLGALIKSSLTSQDNVDKKLSILLSVLEVSRVFKNKDVTQRQLLKFKEAIIGEKSREDIYDFSYGVGQKCSTKFPKLIMNKFKYQYRNNHKFTFAGLNTKKPLTTFVPKEIVKEEHQWLLSFLECTVTSGPWTTILESMGVPIVKGASKGLAAGRISVIQEGALKARVIAVPTAGVQVCFKPLHDTLSSILKALPEDCTHDQEKGVKWGSKELQRGKVVHAVDLSSATDNFPIGFQRAVLDSLKYKYRNEFIETCQMPWGFKGDSLRGPLQYSKGQPMGLYGSFALFALSHHYLLHFLEGLFGVKDTYRILGDDIIISDSRVHKQYLKSMSELGVPISHSKCLDSDLYTEFAGKLISAQGRIPVAKGPKHKSKNDLLDVNQFKNYCEVSGTTKYAISGVPKKYRNYAEMLMSLPKAFGGLGLNPEGKSLEERLTQFEDSKQTVYPIQTDLSASCKRLPFKAVSDHVGLVCGYVNEQLTSIHVEVDEMLKKLGYDFGYNSDLGRSILNQMLDSNGEDNTVGYKGTISEDIKRRSSPLKDWKDSKYSVQSSIEEKFDKTDLRQLDHYVSPSPWM